MAVASKLMSIAIIVLSVIVGLVFYYVLSDETKVRKMKQLEEFASQLINFVIFIWIGKIILHFSVFIKDPLAILAYPSGSQGFYLAVLFSGFVLAYKSKRGRINMLAFIASFLPVFLAASFTYEFIQLIWNNNTYSFGYIVLLTILMVSYLLIRGHVTTRTLICLILIGWTTGILVLSFIQPFVTVFGYIMAPWFVGVFFIVSLFLLIRKRDRNGRN
ncbi:hypothetical protein [Lentibacillus sp. Marseille-P4043]|uniref:hypothetical protein n=1 Tax=Lentibacillus sp. Marseille-P4043 TaxID=2040293 RepID=UPI000D0B1F60|nr:hypothetical protein [Lentibacillus sp. Marseille-P4043]